LGTNFLVCQDGSLTGSIGGGSLEARVIEAAEGLLGRDAALVMEIRMTGEDVAGTEMICGGDVDVLVQSMTPVDIKVREALEGVLRIMERGGEGILAVGPLPEKGREDEVGVVLCRPDAEPIGNMPEEKRVLELIRPHLESTLKSKAPYLIPYGGEDQWILLEPLFSEPTVIIFGGGHISVKLAPILDTVGFKVVVVDDRVEFANQDRFPEARQIVVADFLKCFDQLEFTPETYCIIVTRAHLHDKTVLENVLARPTRYVGMIGSRRKRNMVYEALVKEGLPPERLKEVYAPIGLPIGAETPEEIAISISAELIQVRAEGLHQVKDWKV
jgi:xanthine dehydrogenase accessory factor